MSMLRVLLMFAFILPAGTSQAVSFHDMEFPDRVKLQGSRLEAGLNGIGYRSKFFFKIYIGALYTPERSSSTQLIMEQKGPKRILMHFLHEEVEREKLVDAWNEGFEGNNDEATLAELADRIKQFNDLFPTLRAGDVVKLDYTPRTGTRVIIRGTEVGVIPGKDFNDALLKIWLGEEPADDDLKDAMLGL